MHIVEHVVVKEAGTHCATAALPVRKWQLLVSLIATTVPPLVVQVASANALEDDKTDAANASVPKAAVRKERFIVG